MRFSSAFIEFARKRLYTRGSKGDRILRAIVSHRITHNLDEQFLTDDPWDKDRRTLAYEFFKLATVFEAIHYFDDDGDRLAMIEVLKEQYPSDEIDQIVAEYFPALLRNRGDADDVLLAPR